MQIKPLKNQFKKYLLTHQLKKKFDKQKTLFEKDPHHPSLHTELLKPEEQEVYSFRIDRKYRVIFIVIKGKAEIVDINLHYQ